MSSMVAVIDTETLGRYDAAVILSIGLVIADLDVDYTLMELVENHSHMIRLDAIHQLKNLGREKEDHIVEWWASDPKVSDEARKASFLVDKDTVFVAPEDVAANLSVYCRSRGVEPRAIKWFDRNSFDFTKVQHLIEKSCGQKDGEPWHYHHTIDIVSFFCGCGVTDRYAGIKAWEVDGMIYHHPVHDAALDWLRLQKVMRGQA